VYVSERASVRIYMFRLFARWLLFNKEGNFGVPLSKRAVNEISPAELSKAFQNNCVFADSFVCSREFAIRICRVVFIEK
jgi:hypothetical protein